MVVLQMYLLLNYCGLSLQRKTHKRGVFGEKDEPKMLIFSSYSLYLGTVLVTAGELVKNQV